ncbi:hypothetical protein [Falsiroseomonas sp. HW251]|uniref:hypothetical protein n=1 Tax=Falsiroseomonas sp. HW251 TaxID=3390998 RepID=UPI003D3241C9
MTAAEVVAIRVAPFWMSPERFTGSAVADATAMMSQRYRKADGASLTQFNTGGLLVRDGEVIALTECQPREKPPGLRLASTSKSRAAIIDDIRAKGPPTLAVLFAKGAFDLRAWVCSTPDEVVLNGVAGPEEFAAMEDVVMLRDLPGSPRDWRWMTNRYTEAEADFSKAPTLHAEADKFAAKVGVPRDRVLDVAHRLRHASGLTFDLAAPSA